ncbi:MAG: hypothetical protein KKG59_02390 [Nanoarchaeota archaeon]|nr:hypothetical protein [Nanoarchaeota archaeon]
MINTTIFGNKIDNNRFGAIDTKIRIAYITSCREVGLDELIGREIVDPINGLNYGYRAGNLENMARILMQGDSEFASNFELVSVLVDDNSEQYRDAWSQAELWPRDLQVPLTEDGLTFTRSLEDITTRIPSQPWKSMRRMQEESRTDFRARKAHAKALYEAAIVSQLISDDVDILISDSYTTIFGPTVLNHYGGLILNIHPAITAVGHPDRLPGLTPTRDAFTRAMYGHVIVSDKHAVDTPDGPRVEVEYEGQQYTAVIVPQSTRHGVTVHVVSEAVDNGPVVLCDEYDINDICRKHGIHMDDITPEAIRDHNYDLKRDILQAALFEYSRRPEVQQQIEARRETNRPLIEVFQTNDVPAIPQTLTGVIAYEH